jgi:chromosome segregation ATPase
LSSIDFPLASAIPTSPQVASLVGGRAVPAVSLVEADADLRPAIEHVFGAAFVCEVRPRARGRGRGVQHGKGAKCEIVRRKGVVGSHSCAR